MGSKSAEAFLKDSAAACGRRSYVSIRMSVGIV